MAADREESERTARPIDLVRSCVRLDVDDRQHTPQRRRRPVSESLFVTTAQLIVVRAAVFIAAFLQIVAGFGFALLSVPLMTLAIDPKIAVVVASLTSVFVTTWQAYKDRSHADRVLVKRMAIAAYVGMPLGLVVFFTVNSDALRLMLGIAVLIAAVLLALQVNLHNVGPRLDLSAGFVSGVLATSLSTNGPPLVFALQARQLDAVRFRATIATVFAICNVGGLTLFIASGKVTQEGLIATAVTIPALLVGQLLGYPVPQARPRRTIPLARAGADGRRRPQRHCQRSHLMIVALLATAIAAFANWYAQLEEPSHTRDDFQAPHDHRRDRHRGDCRWPDERDDCRRRRLSLCLRRRHRAARRRRSFCRRPRRVPARPHLVHGDVRDARLRPVAHRRIRDRRLCASARHRGGAHHRAVPVHRVWESRSTSISR